MSKEVVSEVINKALTDLDYRSQLFADPKTALAGLDLTEQEQIELSGINREAFDEFVTELEQRESKGGLLRGFDDHELSSVTAGIFRRII